jgi:co-chaperonin GroES (HSP10)
MRMNSSGVTPKGDRVLVMPDEISEEVTPSGIVLPEFERVKHQLAQTAGRLVAVGPDAWKDRITTVERVIDGELRIVERRTTGYSEPFAEVGDRVCFAQYNGRNFEGEDGKTYRILNDEDITGTVSDKIDFTEMRGREPLGVQ